MINAKLEQLKDKVCECCGIGISAPRAKKCQKCKAKAKYHRIYSDPERKKKRNERTILNIWSNPVVLERKRERDRRRIYNPIKSKEAAEKYRSKPKFKEWNLVYSEKKKREAIERLTIERAGAICKITPLSCAACSMLVVRRGDFTHRPENARFCNGCSKKHKKTGLPVAIKQVNCKKCGGNFFGKKVGSLCRFCLLEHKREYRKKRLAAGICTRKGGYNRARHKGNVAIPFRRKDVFERDNYQCKMCMCVVQKVSIYAHDAAEIDHIIPISRGGPHTIDNAQTLCRRCNAIKSDRILYTCVYDYEHICWPPIKHDTMNDVRRCETCYTQGMIKSYRHCARP